MRPAAVVDRVDLVQQPERLIDPELLSPRDERTEVLRQAAAADGYAQLAGTNLRM